MTVTEIQDLTKKKSKVIFDTGYCIVLYKGEISKYRIVCDEEISPSSYNEIMTSVLPKRAKQRAMHLLKVRPYTERNLRDKLAQSGYPGDIVDIAIEYVSSFGYIDDKKYAEDYVYTYRERKSQKRIEFELAAKGISRDIISRVLASEVNEGSELAEEEQIRKYLVKKDLINKDLSYEDKAKLKASLYRKGYDPNLIDRII